MTNIDKHISIETIQLLSKHKIVFGIVTYIVIGEFLKDAIIFPIVEPYLLSVFSPFITERLAEFSEYLLLSSLLISITFYFVVEPVNSFVNSLTKKNKEVQDINVRLEAEKNLLDIMFRTHASVMLIVDPLNNGKILDANNSALDFYGYSYDEITNLEITDINMSLLDEVNGAMVEAHNGSQNVFYFCHKLKSGALRDVEVHSSKISILDEELLFSIIHDITDKLCYQSKLKESEEKFRILFENSGNANYISSLEGHILDANTAFLNLFGYKSEELSGLNTQDLYIEKSDRKNFTKVVNHHGFVKNFEERLQRKNSESLDCQVTATVHHSADGSAIGYHGSIQDITEDKLKQKEKDKLISELQEALSKVRKLSGFLPICMHCKKIRDDQGYWNQLEAYFAKYTNTEFSHSLCRECAQKYYPDMDIYGE